MNAKLTTGTIPRLLADYDTIPSDPPARLVAGALRLSAHVLADDPGQLPSQLTGRLASQHDPQLRDLLLRTLAGHDGPVWAVAVSPDGRRAISGGRDRTLRVWDLDMIVGSAQSWDSRTSG